MTALDQSRKRFLKTLVNMYGSHLLWTDGAQWYSDTKATYSNRKGFTVTEG
jgi:hypothetical protein